MAQQKLKQWSSALAGVASAARWRQVVPVVHTVAAYGDDVIEDVHLTSAVRAGVFTDDRSVFTKQWVEWYELSSPYMLLEHVVSPTYDLHFIGPFGVAAATAERTPFASWEEGLGALQDAAHGTFTLRLIRRACSDQHKLNPTTASSCSGAFDFIDDAICNKGLKMVTYPVRSHAQRSPNFRSRGRKLI